MKINIDRLSEEELVELNHRIVERLKFLETLHHHNEMMKFNIGDQVSFESSGRVHQIGTLTKFNKKSITVITETGKKWTVSPHLLSKIKTVKTKSKHTEDNVIEFNGKDK